MHKARFSEEQTPYSLKQIESGRPVGEVCRQVGVSEQSFYRWKRRYEGMGVAELRRLRQLEEENRKLKEDRRGSFAGQAHLAGCDLKKALRPARKRRLVEWG